MNERFLKLFMITMFLSGVHVLAADSRDPVKPYDWTKSFEADPKPTRLKISINPLDYAGQRINMDVRNFILPRGHEGEYRFSCRQPIIDYVSNQPLYMKQWAEEHSRLIMDQHARAGLTLTLDALTVLCGTSWTAQIQGTSEIRTAAAKTLSSSPFTREYQKILLNLYVCLWEAKQMVKRSRRSLTPQDIIFYNENPGYFIMPDGKRMPELTGNNDAQSEFIERSRRIAFEYIFSAAQIMAIALQSYVTATRDQAPLDCYADPARSKEAFPWETDIGTIYIYGLADDNHSADAGFLIDLGGDDTYSNNAGGCGSASDMIAVCIDHAGNDTYSAAERNYVQGFGFLGCGFLIDLAGNDRYTAQHLTQGAGMLGVGILWDRSGDDTYTAQTFCQGAAAFGLGMVLDDRGHDIYDCASIGQGGATTLGLGILSDLSGDDLYQLSWTENKNALSGLPGYGQGGALSFRGYPWRKKLTAYGGIGMLVDRSGNDQYKSKGWCVQGGSYIMSLGVLYDRQGNDDYFASCGQGSGIHVTNAILIDQEGNDSYAGGFRNGGSGGDRTPGFLIDYQGNDTYRSTSSSYGTAVKPFAFSLFIDYQGDDTYISAEPKGKIEFNNWDAFGGVWPESEPQLWPYAICLDLGGNDDYQVRNRRNNSERHSFGHGIHIDTEYPSRDIIGEVENPLPGYREFCLPARLRGSKYRSILQALFDPHLFVRFQAIPRAANADSGIIPVLVDILKNSSHRQINRDIMECVHYLFVAGKLSAAAVKDMIPLLNAWDEEVRLLIADDLGLWGFATAENDLIRALRTEDSGAVRRFILRALLEIRSVRALPIVRDLAENDASTDVRRIALRYLTRLTDDTDPVPLLEKIVEKTADPVVKTAAVDALGYFQRPAAVRLLRKAAKTRDAYLQRAAGKALVESFCLDGIPILIRSLSFPSIDAFYNYDNNIPNFLMNYMNHDFTGNERYNQRQWQQWFNKNKKQIDLKSNVTAFRAYQALNLLMRDSTPDRQIKSYETFLLQYPDYLSVRKALAAKLNEQAWNMATAPQVTKEFDPKTALVYARRAVELKPDVNFYDTLIQAYIANGMTSEAIQLCKDLLKTYPEENTFINRLKQMERP